MKFIDANGLVSPILGEESKPMIRSGIRWALLVLTGLIAISILTSAGIRLCTPAATADDPGTSDLRPYSLDYAKAADVESRLAPLVPKGSEVVADTDANRIIVRGGELTQQIAQKAIQALDQSPSNEMAAAPAPPKRSTELKAYTVPAGKAKTAAAALQEEFGAIAGVRIVPDERTAQILVFAPPDVHTRIARRLAAGEPAADNRAAAQAGTATAAEERTPIAAQTPPSSWDPTRVAQAKTVNLIHTDAMHVEESLAGMLGNRFSAVTGTPPDTGSYRVAATDGSSIGISIDRRSNRVIVVGSGPIADSFVRLVQVLDGPQESAEQSVRFVPVRTTRSADVHRTVEAIRASNRQPPAKEPAAAVRAPDLPRRSPARRARRPIRPTWRSPRPRSPARTKGLLNPGPQKRARSKPRE